MDLCVVENIDKYQFYKAVLIVIEAVKTYALRFSKLAKELAMKADEKRKAELLEISRICAKVPYEPAQTFHEAVQSTWFIQLILQIESNGHSLSYGVLISIFIHITSMILIMDLLMMTRW